MLENKNWFKFLCDRGFIYQSSNDKAISNMSKDKKVYVGYDVTAPSLHVGNLLTIVMLRWMQKFGFDVIIVIGTITTKICDPSGKDKMRPPLTQKQIESNAKSIKKNFHNLLDPDKTIFLENNWLSQISFLDFLNKYGIHFSVSRMLGFESIKARLDRRQNLNFVEMNYMILQAIDFVHLRDKYNCCLQIGGQDQWGNIISGIDLGQKMQFDDMYGLTLPLMTNTAGQKMGKSAGNAVWLDRDMYSEYDFWQFWRNVDDHDVIKFLKLYTYINDDEIKEMELLQGSEINKAKIMLADFITEMNHGKDALDNVHKIVRSLYDKKGEEKKVMPTHRLDLQYIKDDMRFIEILVKSAICESKAEARRQIRNQAISVNDRRIDDETVKISDFIDSKGLIAIEIGKKRKFLISFE